MQNNKVLGMGYQPAHFSALADNLYFDPDYS